MFDTLMLFFITHSNHHRERCTRYVKMCAYVASIRVRSRAGKWLYRTEGVSLPMEKTNWFHQYDTASLTNFYICTQSMYVCVCVANIESSWPELWRLNYGAYCGCVQEGKHIPTQSSEGRSSRRGNLCYWCKWFFVGALASSSMVYVFLRWQPKPELRQVVGREQIVLEKNDDFERKSLRKVCVPSVPCARFRW